jgi:predicted membrane protein
MSENRPPHGKGQPVLDELQLVCGNFNMDLLADIIGMAGTSLVVGAFFLLQLNKVSPKGLTYNLMNLIGALFLLFSLCINFNLASFVIEVFWIAASVIGLVQYRKNKNAVQAA